MQIDPLIETLYSLDVIRKDPVMCVNGRATSKPKIHRCRLTGIVGADGQRHRLECIKTPGGWATSREAVARFLAALTGLHPTELPTTSAKHQSNRAEAAQRELEKLGFDRAERRSA